MESYYQNEGVNRYLVVETSEESVGSYEMEMLYNNYIHGIIQPEIRSLDTRIYLYYRVNGMQRLSEVVAAPDMAAERAAALFTAVCDVVSELDEYMLLPDRLALEADSIFYDSRTDEYRFAYVAGREAPVAGQLKKLTEDIIRMINHRNRELVDVMYDAYDMVHTGSFDMDELCGFADKHRRDERDTDTEIGEQRMDSDNFEPVQGVKLTELSDKKTVSGGKSTATRIAYAAVALTILAAVIIAGIQYRRYGHIENVKPVMGLLACAAAELLACIQIGKCEVSGMSKSSAETGADISEAVRGGITDAAGDTVSEAAGGRCAEEQPPAAACSTAGRDEVSCADMDTCLLTDDDEPTCVLTDDAQGGACIEPDDSHKHYELQMLSEFGRWSFDVGERDVTVGRDGGFADIVINDPTVSRHHAVLRARQNGVYIEDTGSKNGTCVNGERLAENCERLIHSNDIIAFGRSGYRVLVI